MGSWGFLAGCSSQEFLKLALSGVLRGGASNGWVFEVGGISVSEPSVSVAVNMAFLFQSCTVSLLPSFLLFWESLTGEEEGILVEVL